MKIRSKETGVRRRNRGRQKLEQSGDGRQAPGSREFRKDRMVLAIQILSIHLRCDFPSADQFNPNGCVIEDEAVEVVPTAVGGDGDGTRLCGDGQAYTVAQ